MPGDPVHIVSADEAKARFSELLARAEAGQEITITKKGSPVAKLVPLKRATTPVQRLAAIKRIRERSAFLSLSGAEVKHLLAQGRK